MLRLNRYNNASMYIVIVKKKVSKGLRYLPSHVVQKFAYLVRDLV